MEGCRCGVRGGTWNERLRAKTRALGQPCCVGPRPGPLVDGGLLGDQPMARSLRVPGRHPPPPPPALPRAPPRPPPRPPPKGPRCHRAGPGGAER